MKKWCRQLLLIMFCCSSLAESVSAAPSVGGETGNLMTPSADMMRVGQVQSGWYERPGEHSLAVAVPLTNRLEISALRRTMDGRTATEAGFKYSLRGEGVLLPGIAVGVEDLTREHQRSVYAVVSKTLPYGIRVHLGAGNGRYAGGFAALELRLFPRARVGSFPDTTAWAEQVDGHAAYGVRCSLARGLKLAAGVDGHDHFVGISYNFY